MTNVVCMMGSHPDGTLIGMRFESPPEKPFSDEQLARFDQGLVQCPMGCEHGLTRVDEARYQRWAEADEDKSITCPVCFMTSYHPEDVRQGYCGSCHAFTSPPMEDE